ncbi:MAG: NADH-quinone oxidoreductase subunit NuoH [Symbiobacteriia bacterium]
MSPILASIIKGTVTLVWVLANVLFLVWLERKISAWLQNRMGPMRTGRWGWAQTIADGLKCILKEDIIPTGADKALFVLAPMISVASALLVWIVIPFGPGRGGIFSDLPIGIIFIAAVTSFSIISVFMSGWGSNNKYSLFGSMRGAAQMISYEVALVMSILGVVMLAGSLSLQDIITRQAQAGLLGWYIFKQPVAFIIYVIAALAELNRAPFDLMEAESELVSGYHTEYSGIRWLLFMLAEYGHLLSWSAIAAALFLGGWTGPGLGYFAGSIPALNVFNMGIWPYVTGFFWFVFKTYLFIFGAMWLRWTLPRVRIDQLMDIGWKFLLPVSLVNIAVTAVLFDLGSGPLSKILGWYVR